MNGTCSGRDPKAGFGNSLDSAICPTIKLVNYLIIVPILCLK
jgi:hypothetical protein